MSFLTEDEIDIEINKLLPPKLIKAVEEEQKSYSLSNSWKLWYGRWDAPKQVMTFSTIEDFCALFNNIKCPTMLTDKMDYHLFLNGVEPKSEDKNNVQGGSLSVECSLNEVNKYWLYSCMALIGNNFTHHEQINGLMVNVRPKFGRIQLWTKSVKDLEMIENIANEWKRLIEAPSKQQIKFTTHEQIFLQNDTKPKMIF